jgi:hypothetical protein
MEIPAGSYIWSIRRIPLTILTTCSIIHLAMPWLVELCIFMMMLGFMTMFVLVHCVDCWCIVGQLPSWVSLLYLSHPCHLSLFQLNRGVTGRKLKADARWRKEDIISLYLPSHLVVAFVPSSSLWWKPHQPRTMDTEDPAQRQQKRMTVYLSQQIIIFVSLLLVSSFFDSRNEIPFKGGRFVTPWNFQFQDVNRKNN